MTNLALVINSNGDFKTVEFTKENEYATTREAVGGYIEAVTLREDLIMWVNENGLAEQLPINPLGCACYFNAFGTLPVPIVGNLVFTGGADEDGYCTSVTESAIAWINEQLDFLDGLPF